MNISVTVVLFGTSKLSGPAEVPAPFKKGKAPLLSFS
jgi:hypothetical protein